jgi:hypothetical protein
MTKKSLKIAAIIFFFCANSFAQDGKNFPNISGEILYQVQADRVITTNKSNVSANNAFIYIEPNISLNFNKNWSIKTDWRLQPNDVLTTRDSQHPERYRTFLQTDRGFKPQNTGLLLEELKLNFENDDLRFILGKFDPTFGTAYKKAKRIGVFTSQFTEDYNLREKIGGGVTAFLEDIKITANTFFNDTTNLSQSALNQRGKANSSKGVAGNNKNFSSYSLALEGENLLGFEGWTYNAGYRKLGVDKSVANRGNERGYFLGSEYAYKTGLQSSLIPFFEVAKIDNFTGAKNRNALYTTAALTGKYSNWNASVSHLTRNIKKSQEIAKSSDRQLQFSIGYKFANNVTLDVSRSSLKEDGKNAALVGFVVGYLQKF